MKTYLFDTLNRYKRFSQELDVKTILCNKSWWVFNDSGDKELYIFQEDGSLLISLAGLVTNASWKYIPANKSIVVSTKEASYMLHPAYVDATLFALRLDGTDQVSFMIDENNKESSKFKTYTNIIEHFQEKERLALEAEQRALEYKRKCEEQEELRIKRLLEQQKQEEYQSLQRSKVSALEREKQALRNQQLLKKKEAIDKITQAEDKQFGIEMFFVLIFFVISIANISSENIGAFFIVIIITIFIIAFFMKYREKTIERKTKEYEENEIKKEDMENYY